MLRLHAVFISTRYAITSILLMQYIITRNLYIKTSFLSVKKLGFTDIPAQSLHAALQLPRWSGRCTAFKSITGRSLQARLQSPCRQQLALLFDSRGRSRLEQPLHCQVAMDYANQQGYRIQIFDGDQWRNATPQCTNSTLLACGYQNAGTLEPFIVLYSTCTKPIFMHTVFTLAAFNSTPSTQPSYLSIQK